MNDQSTDEQKGAEPEPEASAANQPAERDQDDQTPLPAPSLKTFISATAGQALISLGLFENPVTKKREANLEQAKYTIDLLQILRDKMRGNLDEEEEKLFDTVLYDLRMRYVQACR